METPKNIRRERLDETKENLSRRYEGVAKTIQVIKATIEADPDSSSEVLISLVNPIAVEHELGETQLKFIKEAIREYEEKHKAIK